jgi:hypothetical protein
MSITGMVVVVVFAVVELEKVVWVHEGGQGWQKTSQKTAGQGGDGRECERVICKPRIGLPSLVNTSTSDRHSTASN